MINIGLCNECGLERGLIRNLCMRCRLRVKHNGINDERLEQKLEIKEEKRKEKKQKESIKKSVESRKKRGLTTKREPRVRKHLQEKPSYKNKVLDFLGTVDRPQTTGEIISALGTTRRTVESVLSDLFKLGLIHRQYFKGYWQGKEQIKLAFFSLNDFTIVNGVGLKLYDYLKEKRKPVSISTILKDLGFTETPIRNTVIYYPEIFGRMQDDTNHHKAFSYYIQPGYKIKYIDGLVFLPRPYSHL